MPPQLQLAIVLVAVGLAAAFVVYRSIRWARGAATGCHDKHGCSSCPSNQAAPSVLTIDDFRSSADGRQPK